MVIEAQLVDLGYINNKFLYHGVYGFDNSEILNGRPYGGCAIFWRADSAALVETVVSGSKRICAIRMCSSNWRMLFLNVYMPYEDGSQRTDEFISQLSIIEYIINQNLDCHVVLGGDFNVDFSRSWTHTALLNDFCENAGLEPTIRSNCCTVDYTYNFNMDRFNVLDHLILSGTLFDDALVSVDVIHDGDNLSDHDPIIIKLNLYSNIVSLSQKVYREKIAWYKASEDNLSVYRNELKHSLNSIIIPVEALACHDPLCCSLSHCNDLNKYASDIMEACISAARAALPRTTSHDGQRRMPGWSEHVEPVRAKSILWHNIWVECGRPKTGTVADIMRRNRAQYHYTIRRIKRNEDSITIDSVLLKLF